MNPVFLVLAWLFSTGIAVASVNEIVTEKAVKYGVDERLVHAVIKTESSYNQNAISKAGAGGLMQLMPDTAVRFGVSDRFNAEQNIDGGTHYLRVLLDMFDNNINLALAGYNAGEGAVIKHGGVPPYDETQEYIRRVKKFYEQENGETIVLEPYQSEAVPVPVKQNYLIDINSKPKYWIGAN